MSPPCEGNPPRPRLLSGRGCAARGGGGRPAAPRRAPMAFLPRLFHRGSKPAGRRSPSCGLAWPALPPPAFPAPCGPPEASAAGGGPAPPRPAYTAPCPAARPPALRSSRRRLRAAGPEPGPGPAPRGRAMVPAPRGALLAALLAAAGLAAAGR